MQWRFGRHEFTWRSAPRGVVHDGVPLVMGVLNVTPDSFSDGGRFVGVERAVQHGLSMVAAGASLIDVGGESSRPGAEPVPATVEIERVVPVIRALRSRTDVCISIDTTKAMVARAALDAGAEVINDISALTLDPEMLPLAVERGAGVALMHMRGVPQTMQQGDLSSTDIVADVARYLGERVDALCAAGVDRDAISVDPGIGFGKTVQQNLALVARLDRLAHLDRPILLGVSRKSFIGAVTERPVDERLAGTCAAHAIGAWMGAHVIRVHDVAEALDVVRLTAALRSARAGDDGRGDGRGRGR